MVIHADRRSSFSGAIRRFSALYTIYAKEAIAYPAVVMIWFMADTLGSIVLPFVWIAAAGKSETVAGLTRSEMVTYYLVAVVLSQFTTSHMMWDIAWDIQEGMVTTYLLRPVDYLTAKAAQNLAWRSVKLVCFIPFLIFCFLVYRSLAPFSEVHFTPAFFGAALLAMLLSFLANFCMAMIGFWVVEARNIMEVYYLPEMFLSGRVLPLTALPAWAVGVGSFFHFRYTNAFAIDICLGRLTPDETAKGFAATIAWIAVFAILGRIAFDRGRRVYTGVGN